MSKTDKNSFDGSLQTKGAFFRKVSYDRVADKINDSAKRCIDSETGEVDRRMTVERACLVCGSSERRLLFNKNGFPHVKCLKCGFLYVNPILREDILIDYYSAKEDWWSEVTEKEDYNLFQNKYYHFHIDNIEAYATTSTRTILDIGCNNGEFLTVARDRGWTPVGHELNSFAVARARKKGIEVLHDKFSADLFKGRRFGAVALLGVLEHLPHPADFLKVVRAMIEPDGILTTLVPNVNSLTTRVLREKCNTFDGIEHVNLWGPETFARFLANNGFETVHAETTISEIYTLNNHLHFEHPYEYPSDHPLLLDAVTPEYLHARFLGHHLCSYARPV